MTTRQKHSAFSDTIKHTDPTAQWLRAWGGGVSAHRLIHMTAAASFTTVQTAKSPNVHEQENEPFIYKM